MHELSSPYKRARELLIIFLNSRYFIAILTIYNMLLKWFPFVLLCIFPCLLNAQAKKNTYTTVINKADSVSIRDGVTTISKAGIVYVTVIADLNTKSKIYLIDLKQKLDDDGEYVTILTFKNPYSVEYIDIAIELAFDKPIIEGDFTPYGKGTSELTDVGSSENKMHWLFTAAKYVTGDGIQITLKSKEKIKTKIIRGVQGLAN